jgi:hypothetical protein
MHHPSERCRKLCANNWASAAAPLLFPVGESLQDSG